MTAQPGVAERLGGDEMEVLGRLPWASNATLLVRLGPEEGGLLAVYKPQRGERPLWDFPAGTLCRREMAAFEVSEALGFAIVPPTVLRDGPYGDGMVQLFVDHDPEQHYFTLRDAHPDRFAEFALFDFVINNADRKGGHCLLGGDGHIWGIDHGVSFHAVPKLRTVIWEYEGRPIGGRLSAALDRMDAGFEALEHRLATLLSTQEAGATRTRLAWLRTEGVFPRPVTDHPYPWPMV